MVKVDIKRDYYAELGIDSRAEPEEIRKQYRKLAFKYHPDRNPGREVEFNSKFQGLQTAYEVLNDSQLRLKYDADRLRAGYGKHYGSSRATPTSRSHNTGSPFSHKPPPRPPTAPPNKASYPSASSFPHPPHQWNSYAKAGVPKWDKVYEDVRTRAEAYRAFQNMKPSNHPAGGWTNFDPRTGRSSHETGRTDKPPTAKQQQSQRPHSAYEAYFTTQKQAGAGPQRSQTTKKRNSFAPGTPGGDEPMAKNTSAYATISKGERAQASNPFFEPAPSPTAKKKPAGAGDSGTSMPNLERTSSRYATSGGEKTYVSSAGFAFTRSARSTPFEDSGSQPRTNPPSPTPLQARGRRHSASPKLSPKRNQPFSSPTSSDSDEILPSFRPKAMPRSRVRSTRAKVNRPTHYGNENMSGDTSAWAMHPDSWLFGETINGRQKEFTKANRSKFDDWESPNVGEGVESDKGSHRKTAGRTPLSSNFSKSSIPLSTNVNVDGSLQSEKMTPTNGEPRCSSTPNIFNATNTTPKGDGTHKTPPKSKSHDYISPTFSAKEWSGTFGNDADLFAPGPSGSVPFATKPVPTRGRTLNKSDTSSHFQPSGSSQNAANPSADRASSQPLPPFAEAKFSADRWAELLRDNTWTTPRGDAFPQPSMDPRRQKSPRKQSKPAPKRSTAPRPATVTTEAEEAENTFAPTTNESSNAAPSGSAEAMDIDEPIPSGGAQNAQATPSKESANSSKTKIPNTFDTAPDLLNLTDMGLVNPFSATNNGGINDLRNLNNALPFDSQPDLNRSRIKPRDLALPKPPKPPTLPNFTANPGLSAMKPEQVLARGMWDRYMTDMAAYMNEWNKFNRTMLSHFNARQNFVDTLLSPNWMSARGDGTRLNLGGYQASANGDAANDDDESDDAKAIGNPGKYGFGAYVRGMEEDFVVRQHWEVAWERHRQCILDLGRLRTWIQECRKAQPVPCAESLI
ncbi:DnaJ domain-containing protein [Coccidioides immitis RS]|uniref:DnaJ domain containing protein n=1 Tax=Coccidioides immitis RMSCC 2394 TaxID=404692 RepID=A0A0J6YFX9_COCIT|nr:DnaJ domain-containing protein [Coccidioides immitis RS]EAS32312.3 DnaJ domain-containing protein [Coccidioides immitis RS]KMP07536.1 DnaJ domain containing protein [Coccidioides immitis RMSCC 2394]TPX19459.1 hypothetical protein DIZ76_017250 [Coccidioides immitis]